MLYLMKIWEDRIMMITVHPKIINRCLKEKVIIKIKELGHL